jgi:hypothetical protein
VPSSGLLTSEDLDQIGHMAFAADDPSAVAAELVEAVEQGRVADPAGGGDALLLAAEIAERTGDLAAALGLAQRAVAAHRAGGDTECGFPRAFRAGLLLRLGRDDEAMTEFAALRPLLSRDPDAAWYVGEALEAGGRAELAVQWLTAALGTALQARAALAARRPEPAHGQAAVAAFMLAQQRHRLRRNLGWMHDDYDELADGLQAAVAEALGTTEDEDEDEEQYQATAVLFWPAVELDRLLARWPVLAGAYGQSWDEHRTRVERGLVLWSESGHTNLAVLAGSAEELAGYADRHGGDPADPQVRQDYAQHLTDHPQLTRWPPRRNEPCWCGSPGKYKKCCLPRSRS